MARPPTFSFNAQRDLLRTHQQRLDLTDRRAPTGKLLPFTPVVTAAGGGLSAAWSSLSGKYIMQNDLVNVWVRIVFNGNPAGTGAWRFSMPSAVPGGIGDLFGNWRYFDSSAGATLDGIVVPVAATLVACEYRATHALVAPTYVSNGVPVTTATGDQLWIGYTGYANG